MTEEWEDRWQHGRTGWDQSGAHPALVDLLIGESRGKVELPSSGKAVVPGCGRGYDVDLLAKTGLDALGVDISPTGVAEAQRWLGTQPVSPGEGSRAVIVADYFAWAKSVQGDWDVLLDYTFLCALPPSLRGQWAATFALLARPAPSTRLITLMYPLHPTPLPEADHPPYPLSEEEYHRLLDERWELVYCEPVKPEWKRTVGAPGGEKVGVWAWRA
ncbi:S-adenosyl-L-methionine-dependent methyltransferase [Papiliotrema laurentii]|uniref:S-adenosyl-L-methionine-dependent methyltransferase n=1 Tax=Papiliotrema laurentii TaxID=5418 RepID=A0AAD9FMN5_PAPLA|nr:S-adenosyl-L-methionine-dependent methyltransferase [Papiliotrema laurentii]